MTYTTITNLVKNGRREFEGAPYKTVLSNNEPVGLILSMEVSNVLTESGILDQIREELYELHDSETKDLVERTNTGNLPHRLSLEKFRTKYGV